MTVKLKGQTFELLDYVTLRFVKALEDAGEMPKQQGEGAAAASVLLNWQARFLASLLKLPIEYFDDCRPREVVEACRAIFDAYKPEADDPFADQPPDTAAAASGSTSSPTQ